MRAFIAINFELSSINAMLCVIIRNFYFFILNFNKYGRWPRSGVGVLLLKWETGFRVVFNTSGEVYLTKK